MVPQVIGEEGFHISDRVLFARLVESRASPRLLGAFDDEGAERGLERIGVYAEEAVLVLAEDEREGLERLVGPEPGELAPAPVEVGSEVLGVALADQAVHPVARHEQVGIAVWLRVGDLRAEVDRRAEVLGACVEDLEELLARQSTEAVPGAADARVTHERVDVGPVDEVALDLGERRRVGLLEPVERLVGEHHPPAEGIVGLVTLVQGDLHLRPGLLHEDREVERGRAGADAVDSHTGAMLPVRLPPNTPVFSPPGRHLDFHPPRGWDSE